MTTITITPTRASKIFQRDSTSSSASATDSDGCVVCSSVPACPTCKSNEHCVQTVQTCQECPTTYCKTLITTGSKTSTSKSSIGGIVGGVVGGLLVISVLFFFLYKHYLKKKSTFNRISQEGYYFDDDIEVNFLHNLPNNDPSSLEKPASRESLATTIFTRASNIIPIAYIPGVTIGTNPSSQNSNINSRMSTLSQANTIDSDLVGDRFSKASIVGNPSLTTTAIRAKPKLVNINNTDQSNKKPSSPLNQDSIPSTAVSASQLGGVRSVRIISDTSKSKFKNSGLQNDLIIEEEESDLESKIVPNETSEEGGNTILSTRSVARLDEDYDPFIIDDDGDDDILETVETPKTVGNERDSKTGSMILEVDLDPSTSFNPFEDPSDDETQR